MKALIVEDSFVDRRLLFRIVSQFGEVDIAANGEEAIEAFELAHKEEAPYDLICLDIVLPGISGRDVLEQIRSREDEMGIVGLKGVQVVMVSALEDSDNVLGSFWEGCEAYLNKPYSVAQVADILRELKIVE